MHSSRWLLTLTALVAVAGSVAAQSGTSCPLIVIDGVVQSPATGPGGALGVTAYQCASCGYRREKDQLAEYTFHAEPIVLQTTAWSQLRAGDVIEAVNGHPITTHAGADHFTYPRAGESVIAVRRAGSRVEVKAVPRRECSDLSLFDRNRIERVQVLRGTAAVQLYGLQALGGVIVVDTKKGADTLTKSPVVAPSEFVTGGRYGFAVSCLPSCTRARASDGTEYWKFDGHPPIAGITPRGPAAMAGLRVGDVVTEVDGISILSEAGIRRFQQAERKESLHVTVLRDGKRIGYLLQAQ
jgi:hypothetical protein